MSDSKSLDRRPENPLSDREQRIVEANAQLGESEECPAEGCDLTPHVCDLTEDGTLYVAHEEDGVGLASRTPRSETDGCRVQAENDPTL